MTPIRIASLVVSALFASFAWVQLNDVDGTAWIALYLGAAALCVALAWGAPVRRFAWAVVVLAVAAGLWWLTGRGAWSFDDEVVREAGGFWVVALAIAAFARAARRR